MNNQSTDAKHFTRGGQITLHNLRMYAQIMDKVVLLAVLVFLLTTGGMTWILTSAYERYVCGQYVWGITLPIFDQHASTQFIQPNGEKMTVRYKDLAHANLVKEVVSQVSRKIIVICHCRIDLRNANTLYYFNMA